MNASFRLHAQLVAMALWIAGCSATIANGEQPAPRAAAGPVPTVLYALDDRASEVPADSSPASQPASPGPAVTIRAALSHAAYTQSAPQNLVLKVDYQAVANARADRPPLNIALVLDRSGSMGEDRKFTYTLEAARWIIDNMSDRDTLSIIAFNQQVTVLSAAGRVVNKQFLHHRLDEITPDGYTDLSAGLMEGIAQVASRAADGQVQHVLLLTDGLANRGVTDSPALRGIAAKAKAKGIGLSTLGCGSDFNEKLLSDLATAGAGRYTFIKNPEQIPAAFKDELHGLLEVVAQNSVIEVSITGGQITKVYGQMPDQPVQTYKFNLGNIRSAERGVFLVQVRPSSFENGATVKAHVAVTFDDPQAGERANQDLSVASAFSADADPAGIAKDQSVIMYGGISDALERAEEAVRGLDARRTDEARASFNQWYDRAHQYALDSRDQELLNYTFVLRHFMDELSAAQQQGLLHDHREAMEKLKKESDYQRYLLGHHRPTQP